MNGSIRECFDIPEAAMQFANLEDEELLVSLDTKGVSLHGVRSVEVLKEASDKPVQNFKSTDYIRSNSPNSCT